MENASGIINHEKKILNQWTHALTKMENEKNKSLSFLLNKYSNSVPLGSVRPWNHEDFTSRLLTFQQSANWFAKPHLISALNCARHGWCNEGRDQLYCKSCAAKITHSKDDYDAKRFYDLLVTGHSPHCGWNNNFSPVEFLKFPLKSCEDLQLACIQRIKSILLAFAEWSRSRCLEDIEGNTACSTGNGLSTSPSSIFVKLQVGSTVIEKASTFSKYLLSDTDGDCNKLLEFSLLEAASSSSRSHIANAIESIDKIIRCICMFIYAYVCE
jgi:hypothetical protein